MRGDSFEFLYKIPLKVLREPNFLKKNIHIQGLCSFMKLHFRNNCAVISIDFFNSDSFKKILMCLSGLAIKLQEGEYDAEPPSKTVSTLFCIIIIFPFIPNQCRRMYEEMFTLPRDLLLS